MRRNSRKPSSRFLKESRRIINQVSTLSEEDDGIEDDELEIESDGEEITVSDVVDKALDAADAMVAVAQAADVTEDDVADVLDILPDLQASIDSIYAAVGVEPPSGDDEEEDEEEVADDTPEPDDEENKE